MGFFLQGFFLLLAGYSFYNSQWIGSLIDLQGANVYWASFFGAIALIFLLITLAAPKILLPLNKAWYQLGLLMGRVVSPLVLGILFFIVITPVAIFMRCFGRDELRLNKRNVTSYWIIRESTRLDSESFNEQF